MLEDSQDYPLGEGPQLHLSEQYDIYCFRHRVFQWVGSWKGYKTVLG